MIFTKIRYGGKTELVADFESIERAAEKFFSYQHKGVEIVQFFTSRYCVLKFLKLFLGVHFFSACLTDYKSVLYSYTLLFTDKYRNRRII